MAGFAVFFFVFVVASFTLLPFAGVCSVILSTFYGRKRSLTGRGSRSGAVAFACTPLFALLWIVVVLIAHILISNGLAHQSVGFSSDPYVTLPNGYRLGSGNTYDGYIVAPGFHTDVPSAGPGYVRGLIDIEWRPPFFVGRQHDFSTAEFRRFSFDTRDRSFLYLDPVRPGAHPESSLSATDLKLFTEQQDAVNNDATSYWVLYGRYRHEWPVWVARMLFVFGEAAIVLHAFKLWRRTFPDLNPTGNLNFI